MICQLTSRRSLFVLRNRPAIVSRQFTGSSTVRSSPTKTVDELLIDSRLAPSDFLRHCAVVYSNFLDPEEGDLLVDEISSRLSRYDDMLLTPSKNSL